MEKNLEVQVEVNLTNLSDIAEINGYLKKEHKEKIMKSVNALRETFNNIMLENIEKDKLIKELQMQQSLQLLESQAPTTQNLYSGAVKRNEGKTKEKKGFQLVVRSKTQQSSEYMKTLIKTKLNPTELKVGVSSFKALKNGNLVIETQNRVETDTICKNINEKCGIELEANIKKLRKPRLIIFNVPEELAIEDAREAILHQNDELNLKQEDLVPKFMFQDRSKRKNLIIEVSPQARKIILAKKLKIGWHLCGGDDYIKVNRCFKCSKFNHRAQDCKGEITCPHCTKNHAGKDCNTTRDQYQCINCTNYNKYNKDNTVDVNHSSLDNKNCSCYQMMIERYRQNTEY